MIFMSHLTVKKKKELGNFDTTFKKKSQLN